MDQNDVTKPDERLSAMADGELAGDEVGRLLAESALDSQRLLATWETYHLVGDVMRGGEQSALTSSPDFLARLQSRLAQEPPWIAPRTVHEPLEAEPIVVRKGAEPANESSFRWKMVAGFASFAAVAALAWGVLGGVAPEAMPRPQLASAPDAAGSVVGDARAVGAMSAASQIVEQPVTLASGEAQVMLRDARLDELLAAHKQLGGSSALQMPVPAGLLRSATFAAPDR